MQGHTPVCASFEGCTHFQTTRPHANTHIHTHASQSSGSAEFVTCTLLHRAYSSFSWSTYTEMTDGWALSECPRTSSQQTALMHPIKATEQKQIGHMWDLGLARKKFQKLSCHWGIWTWNSSVLRASQTHCVCTCRMCTHLWTFWTAAVTY